MRSKRLQGEIIANFIGSGENFGFYPRHKGTSLKGLSREVT
jgi:hypothetical protein